MNIDEKNWDIYPCKPKPKRLNEWNTNNWNSLDKIAMFATFVIAVASAWSWATY